MKKWLISILVAAILIFSVVFLLQYMPLKQQKPEAKSISTVELTKSIVDQMFPDSRYTIKDGMIYFSTEISANYQTLYVEQIRFGKFIDNREEYVAILRAPEDVLVHAGGFYYIIAAVFDAETNQIKSQLLPFQADEGEISILRGKNRDYMLFLGSTTFQGYISSTGGIYDPTKGYWERIWPIENDFWNERYAIFGNNSLVLYKKVMDPYRYETLMPPFHFEPEKELIWDSETETFREPTRF